MVLLIIAVAAAGICGAVAWTVSSALKYAATLSNLETKGTNEENETEARNYEKMAKSNRDEFRRRAADYPNLASSNLKAAALFGEAASKLRGGTKLNDVEKWLSAEFIKGL